MANSKDLFQELRRRLTLPVSHDERDSILYLLLEHSFGFSRTDVLAGRQVPPYDSAAIEQQIARINLEEPIQYILGEADFCGRRFYVNSTVLIPRTETEQLISEVIRIGGNGAGSLLDVGTGSGCIAITAALALPRFEVTALDVSEEALGVASANAAKHRAPVRFRLVDFLTEDTGISGIDIIVSNPPYITPEEKELMTKNVLAYEPHLALFVPAGNPLIFYRALARQGLTMLKPGGSIIAEINEHFGKETTELFSELSYSGVHIRKDINGKDRIILATR